MKEGKTTRDSRQRTQQASWLHATSPAERGTQNTKREDTTEGTTTRSARGEVGNREGERQIKLQAEDNGKERKKQREKPKTGKEAKIAANTHTHTHKRKQTNGLKTTTITSN